MDKTSIIEKAKQIQLLILDVDGILTSGIVYYGNQELEIKGFHLHDGLGIKLLQRAGIKVAIITAKNSLPVKRRIKDLNIEYAYLGHENKLPPYEELKSKLAINHEQIAYMGDDLPDIPLIRRAGLSITVPDAPLIIQQHVHYITDKKAGNGAVREVCDFILEAQGHYQTIIQSYLEK